MEEPVVKTVVASYLRQHNCHPILAKGSGPDILYDGIAIEVKGSKFDLKDAIGQITRYAFTQSALEFALPVDVPDLNLLYQLRCLEHSIRSWKSDPKYCLAVYVVAAKGNGAYSVRKYLSAEELLHDVEKALEQQFYASKYGNEDIQSIISRIQTSLLSLDSLLTKILEDKVVRYGDEVALEPGNSGGPN